jgi:hypothetical protein
MDDRYFEAQVAPSLGIFVGGWMKLLSVAWLHPNHRTQPILFVAYFDENGDRIHIPSNSPGGRRFWP